MAERQNQMDIKKMKRREIILDTGKIILGTFLLALALSAFLEPHNIVTGGVTGLGVIVKEVSGRLFGYEVPLYLSNIVINAPLLILGLVIKGKKFMAKTVAGTLLLTFFLYVTEGIRIPGDDMILMALFGGIVCGAGVGLVLSASATTGGTDLLAAIVQHFIRHISVAWLLFIIDASIVIAGSFVFGVEIAMYGVIGIYLTSKIADRVVEGFHYSKAVYIISDQWSEIADAVMQKMERGVTGLSGKGLYKKQDQQVLFCVIASKELVQMKKLIYELDPKAFVVVSDAREVLGEGFLPYNR